MADKATKGLWAILGILIVIAIVIVVLLFNMQKPGQKEVTVVETPTEKQEEFIKVGVLLPLSGEAASWGKNALAGIELAVKEINEKGGINGKPVKLFVEDTKCSSDSVSAIQKLINIDKVDIILGPICSAAAGPALPIARDNNVPVIIVAASAPHLTKIGNNIFRVYPSDAFQGKFIAEFIYNKLGKKKVAIIYVKNDWGEGIKNVFTKRFEELGGEVVYVSGVLQTETDFRTELIKVKDSGVDTLFLPVYMKNGVAALKQIKEMGLNITVIGGDSFAGEEVVKSGYADGVIFTVGKINLPEEFKAKIKSLPGYEDLSVSIAAPLGYDAMKVAALAIQKAGSTEKEAVINALYQLSYNGVSNPTIEFDENGDLKSAIFEVMIIRNKEAVPYE